MLLWKHVADELWGKDLAAALSTGGITISSLGEGVPTVLELPLWAENDAICPSGTPL